MSARPAPRRSRVGRVRPQAELDVQLPPMTEAQFQRAVLDLARHTGWRVYHVHDSRGVTSAGFPDLVLTKPRVATLFVELKTQRGRLSQAQWAWRDDLESTGARYFLWRPNQWDEIEAVLSTTWPATPPLPAA